jgi:hypothetical protein
MGVFTKANFKNRFCVKYYYHLKKSLLPFIAECGASSEITAFSQKLAVKNVKPCSVNLCN